MKVLLLSPEFYGYHSIIKQEIERQGHSCDEVIYPTDLIYSIIGFAFRLQKASIDYLHKKLWNVLKNLDLNYDYVIAIKGSYLADDQIKYLKERNTNAKFSLYIWDDIKFDKRELDIKQYFDNVYSYNPKDCQRYDMKFRSMFYDQTLAIDKNSKNYDLFYIASYRENRFDFINRILAHVGEDKLTSKIIFRCSKLLFLSKRKNLKRRSFFEWKAVPYLKMMDYLSHSKCCVELCPPNQESLTTRSFEALFARTKVITTNSAIKDYDFYNEKNIFVVNERHPKVDLDWVLAPYMDIDDTVLKKYSLESFVKQLMS